MDVRIKFYFTLAIGISETLIPGAGSATYNTNIPDLFWDLYQSTLIYLRDSMSILLHNYAAKEVANLRSETEKFAGE